MLSEKYIENAKEIKKILLDHPDFCPTMEVWNNLTDGGEAIKDSVICVTAMCIAGAQACNDGHPDEYFDSTGSFDHVEFSEDKCGYDFNTDEWDFMYSWTLPNDRDIAIARCDYVIENGRIPPREYWDEFY